MWLQVDIVYPQILDRYCCIGRCYLSLTLLRGFKSSTTAELMLKRAQRQRRLETNAAKRKKLAGNLASTLFDDKKQGITFEANNLIVFLQIRQRG